MCVLESSAGQGHTDIHMELGFAVRYPTHTCACYNRPPKPTSHRQQSSYLCSPKHLSHRCGHGHTRAQPFTPFQNLHGSIAVVSVSRVIRGRPPPSMRNRPSCCEQVRDACVVYVV